MNCCRSSEPPDGVRRIVNQGQEAGPLNSSEAEEDAGVGFDEVTEETEGEIGDHEEFEGVAGEEERRWSLVVGKSPTSRKEREKWGTRPEEGLRITGAGCLGRRLACGLAGRWPIP